MDPSSMQTLKQVYRGTTEWRSRSSQESTIPWKVTHLADLYSYVSTLSRSNFDFKLLRLRLGKDLSFSREMVEFLMLHFQEFFTMPSLHQFNGTLKKNEILAAFISFLLKLLHHETDFVHSFRDRIENLKKELRFLVAILGDTLLRDDELEEVKSLLVESEAVANEAGSFVYSFIFGLDGEFIVTRLDDALATLLMCIHRLSDNITKFSIVSPYISKNNASITTKSAATDSLFIVDTLLVVESLLYNLENLMSQRDGGIVDMKGQVKLFSEQLMLSQTLLRDMKMPQHSRIQGFKEVVMQIRDVAYEAEYLIKTFLVGDSPLWYFTIRLPHVIQKIKLVGSELDEIRAHNVAGRFNAQLSIQAERNIEVDDIPVGLEGSVTHILGQLEGETKQRQIITIFGMPGLGKTTLAKKLYNHPFVNHHFDKRSWCVVSQTYQRKNLLIGILISLGSELDKVQILDMEEECLGENIHKSLMGRRYLIVMDDLWDSNAWDNFQRYFPDEENGSRILFTSRNRDVAPPDSIIHELHPLSDEHCWELLKKKVFHSEPCPPQLQWIGRKIAKSCRGLPLAIVVVAGILSTIDNEESAWKIVGENLVSTILSDQNNSTMQILRLSYKHLPHNLKPCFLYFGAFLEDKEIPVQKLKCLWAAEGFIHKEENKSIENVAESYLMDLIDRSLVIVAKRKLDGGVKTCVVHDLLRDLCLRIAEEENFIGSIDDNNYSIYTKHHRLCISTAFASSEEFFLPFGPRVCSLFGYLKDSSLHVDVSNAKLLRVMDLPRNHLTHGDGIEYLVHLRYLAIEQASGSISSLVNLEFLIVSQIIGRPRSVSSLVEKMVNLRYFISREIISLSNHGSNRYQTNKLEFLSHVLVDKVEDEEMLKHSLCLRKLKCTCKHFVDPQGVYRCPDFSSLNQLESLNITSFNVEDQYDWFHNELEDHDDWVRDEVEDHDDWVRHELEFLDAQYHYPHRSRRPKYIESLGRAALIQPAWTEIKLPSNLIKLTLNNLQLPWAEMSIIGGLPNLQVLKLADDAFVGRIWETRDGEFRQLRFLKLDSLRVRKWNVESYRHFPKLQRLVLRHCYHLREIPCEIGEVGTMQLIEVKSCGESVRESAIKFQEEQRDMSNEELSVIIN